jgi:lipopolysaccharide/colanic/teichoic acid biosynthesis glycosyltransferase
MYKTLIKPTFDFVLALFGLVLLSPIFILVTISLFIANNGKPFFFQQRPGKGGKLFQIIKFKSMTDERDENGNLLPNNLRLTKVGKFIRKTSLDEFPQLLNVIKGDISLIGPRPLLVDYLPLYTKEQLRRHSVKPGITGWAQINGRNAIEWTKKFEYDIFYVDNLSFLLDLKILFLTFYKVLKRQGISASEEVTMVRFDGTN